VVWEYDRWMLERWSGREGWDGDEEEGRRWMDEEEGVAVRSLSREGKESRRSWDWEWMQSCWM